jgi:hypothetical protein
VIPERFFGDHGYLADYIGYAHSLGVEAFTSNRITEAFEASLIEELPFIVDTREGTLSLWVGDPPVAESLSDKWFVFWRGYVNGQGCVRYMFAQESDAIIARFHVRAEP